MIKFGPKHIVVDGVDFDFIGNCPACGLAVYASDPVGTLLHVEPPCAKYNEIEDALEFTTWMRRARGIPDSWVDAVDGEEN